VSDGAVPPSDQLKELLEMAEQPLWALAPAKLHRPVVAARDALLDMAFGLAREVIELRGDA
jgi:hypothetical protein